NSRAFTASGREDAAMSKRRCTALDTLLTFWPPAPVARTAVISTCDSRTSRGAWAMAGYYRRRPGALPNARAVRSDPNPGGNDAHCHCHAAACGIPNHSSRAGPGVEGRLRSDRRIVDCGAERKTDHGAHALRPGAHRAGARSDAALRAPRCAQRA